MRKYVRPTSRNIEVFDGLNETIFLVDSGIWGMGPCFYMHSFSYIKTIDNNNGSFTEEFACRAFHDSHDPEEFPDQHYNDGQNWVFYLRYPVAQGTTFTCGAGMSPATGILNSTGTAVRFTRTDDANDGPDLIGFADLDITYDVTSCGLSDTQLADILTKGLFTGFGVNDVGLQTQNPSHQQG